MEGSKGESAFDRARASASPEAAANVGLVEDFFAAAQRLDFEKVGSFFAEDGRYEDVPAPQGDAVGPEGVRRKLWVALEGLDAFPMRFSSVVASGDTVATERVEDWVFPTGEVLSLPVLCLHRFRNGKVVLWREYWNMQTFTEALPQSHMQKILERSQS